MIHGNWLSYLAEQNVGNQTLKHFLNNEATGYSFNPGATYINLMPVDDQLQDTEFQGDADSIWPYVNDDNSVTLYNAVDTVAPGSSSWPSTSMGYWQGVNVNADSYLYVKYSSDAQFNAYLTFMDGSDNTYEVNLSEAAGVATASNPDLPAGTHEYFVNFRSYIKDVYGNLAPDALSLTKCTYYVIGAKDSHVRLYDMHITSNAVTNVFMNDYKALMVEFMGNIKNDQSGVEGAEYFVDAVIDCSVDFDESPHQIKAKTDFGYVLYIPNAVWDSLPVKPSRGDLIDASFAHNYASDSTVKSGISNAQQTLTFYDNPANSFTYAEPVDVNATVNVFNYGSDVSKDGFNFWNGFWGLGSSIEAIDGPGIENGEHQYPIMSDTPDVNGYPQLSNGYSLSYLFETADNSAFVNSMANGGGLFQQDANGYYYYDSLQNAAYYDADQGKFVLYEDLIVRPWYHANAGDDYKDGSYYKDFANAAGRETVYGNFLPFNKITPNNITVDGAVYDNSASNARTETVNVNGQDIQITLFDEVHNPTVQTLIPGSLEKYGLTNFAADKLLAGTKAMNDTAYKAIVNANGKPITSARLEEKVDMGFGMTVDFDFYMSQNGLVNGDAMEFDFLGDDDVFVYLGIWTGEKYEYKLILDIGGIHEAKKGNINFATGEVIDCPSSPESQSSSSFKRTGRTLRSIFGEDYAEYFDGDTFADYTKLSLKFYYMERGGNISYCRLRFNIPLIPDDSLTISKGMDQNVIGAHDYSFRVLKATGNETDGYVVTDESFIPVGTVYTIVGSDKTGTVGENGWITVSSGQAVRFNDIVSSGQGTLYVIEEKIPENILAQYPGAPSVTLNGSAVAVTGENGIYRTDVITANTSTASRADNNQFVAFTNTVDNLGTLKITKLLANDVDDSLKTKTYRMQVAVNGALLPVGTKYTVTDGDAGTEGTVCTVTEKGVVALMADQTVQISNILTGSHYSVTELDTMTGGFAPSYTAEVTGDGTTKLCTSKNISGTMGLNGEAHVTVTNSDNTTGLVVDKTVAEGATEQDFILTLEAFATGNSSQVVSTKPADIVLVLDQSSTMYTPVGWHGDRIRDDDAALINNTLKDYAITDFLTEARTAGSEIQENAKRLGYYVAVHNVYNYIYLVQYAQDANGNWGWYYVVVDETTRSIDAVDTNSTNTDSAYYFNRDLDYGTVVWINNNSTNANKRDLFTNVTYYKSQYGALVESVESFVDGLKNSGVAHKVAIVGFASPFYDGFDGYEGTGIYVDGQYYLYDTSFTESLYIDSKGYIDPDSPQSNGIFVEASKKYISAEQIAAIQAKSAESVYGSALVDVSTESGYISIINSVDALRANYQQTCPAIGLEIAQAIFEAKNSSEVKIGQQENFEKNTAIPSISGAQGTTKNTTQAEAPNSHLTVSSGDAAQASEDRDEIIILFTDGVPTVRCSTVRDDGESSDQRRNEEYWSIAGGIDDAFHHAAKAKAAGIDIYTIGTSMMNSDTNILDTLNGNRDLGISTGEFLNYLSSNYKDSSCDLTLNITWTFDSQQKPYLSKADGDDVYPTITVTPGAAEAGENYFLAVGTDNLELDDIFTTIVNKITAPNVSLNGVDVLQEVLSQYFNISDKSMIKVYTAAYDGEGDFADNSNFAQRQELTTAHITVLKSDPTSDREDVVQVRGYDYHSEYLRTKEAAPDATYFGSKLIVEVPIIVREGFWGGNNVPTNGDDTTIFDVPDSDAPPADPSTPFNPPVYTDDDDNKGNDDGGTEVIDFPLPEVNVPADVEVVAKDKVTYYGNDVNATDLIESVTAGGLDVTINDDGTFTPQQPWMDDYADLQWTDSSTKPGDDVDTAKPDDYTFSVELTPKYDGTPNPDPGYSNMAGDVVPPQGDTASDTAKVDILVPVITFHDSLKDVGTTPNCDTENRYPDAEWVYIDNNTTPGTASEGEVEPTLSFDYRTPDVLTEDVAVDVTVSSSNDTADGTIDMNDAAIFQWTECDESTGKEFHHEDQTAIERHPAKADSPEFYIHVPGIKPDTIVIDFGLPVNINVLDNDNLGSGKDVVGIRNGLPTADEALPNDTLVGFGEEASGTYGLLNMLDNDNLRYVLNTSNGMQFSDTEVFTYAVQRGDNGKFYYSTVTVIPATSIYYEDNFLTYNVYQYTAGDKNPENVQNLTNKEGFEDLQWKTTAEAGSTDQAQDRPGKLSANDVNNIYGFDGAYTAMSTYSLDSAMRFTASENAAGLRTYGTASFTFTGTGFDVISMTTDKTGTITVQATNTADTTKVYTYMVDTYYGYEYVEKDGEFVWQPSTGDNQGGNKLYQIPVIKADGLPYGTYEVVITISCSKFFDHGQYDTAQYDFYLDAIRIYDPANDGAGNQIIEDAYVADGEGWPAYQELRNLIITANDFNSLEGDSNESVSGIVFIDNTASTDNSYIPTISDYINYGPNNELYLAPGQAIAFNMNMPDNIAAIHLAMKSLGVSDRTAKVSCIKLDIENTLSFDIATATDLYYDITSMNNGTVIIKNAADSTAILSITNIKVTYKDNTADADIPSGITVNTVDISNVLESLTESENDDLASAGDITLQSATLSFESEILVNLYYKVQNADVNVSDMGLLTWSTDPEDASYEMAENIFSGAVYDEAKQLYMVRTKGIAAKNLGDDIYLCVYAKLSNGSYIYSDVITYSPKAYAMSRLQNSSNDDLKKLCVAMLNYGAAAQEYFGYKTDTLMNADLTPEQISAYATGYSSALVADVVAADSSKVGSFGSVNNGFKKRSASVSFDGSFSINFYFTPDQTQNVDVTFYCWSEAAYKAADVLTADNCSGCVTMTESNGSYWATYSGIAPKDIDDTIYVCGTYTVDGVTYSTGVIAYSLGAYCVNRSADDASAMQKLAQATAVYGYCAKAYFDTEVA